MNVELKNIPILHLNTARTWRGGEKQTLYLSRYLQEWGYPSAVICQDDSELHHRLSDMSMERYPVRMRSELDVFSAIAIARIMKRLKPGILHMHTAHAHTLGMMSNLFYRVPVNVVSRRVDFRVGRNFLSRLKYRFPDAYIAVSDAVRAVLIEDGIPEDRVVTIHSGIVPYSGEEIETDYLFDEFQGIDNLKGRIRLVNVAALTPQKDQATLIGAMDCLVKSDRRFILFIVGDGELKRSLLELTDTLGLQDHIVFTGFRDDAKNFIKFSDLFVLSSRWEGLGTSIIDAMALGRPIVATETGGIPELIDSGESGILVERENPVQLAEAIRRLVFDDALRNRISEGAFRRAGEFSIERTVSRTIEVYETLLSDLKTRCV
jgi:glycosyltransferase involved in cell wall biosynthesis